MDVQKKVIIALDFPNSDKASALGDILGEKAKIYKVGSELLTSYGPGIVKELRDKGKDVFLDLKFHDIPNTVGASAKVSTSLGVKIFNVHASGGSEMMKKAKEESLKEAVKNGQAPPLVLGVTILTSLTSDMLVEELKILCSVDNQVIHLAKLAKDSGLDGVVCSPFEAKMIKEACGNDFIVLTPGIRPLWSVTDDQKRFKTPQDAITDGADFLVIGRPVTKNEDPKGAFEKILDEINS